MFFFQTRDTGKGVITLEALSIELKVCRSSVMLYCQSHGRQLTHLMQAAGFKEESQVSKRTLIPTL